MRSSSRSIRGAARIALALGALLIAAPATALPPKLPPVDQCTRDPGLAAFRTRLKLVTARRDRAGLLRLLSPDVLVNFGGSSGRDAFAAQWSFEPGEYGNVWDQLRTMLAMGCARSAAARIIPSLIVQLEPYDDEDLFAIRLVLPGARLFHITGEEKTAVPVEAWSVVTATNTAGDLWTGVKLAGGREGFIADDRLYEPIGYRMVIEKRAGKWTVTAFVAGD
jgi:hypothetical protein